MNLAQPCKDPVIKCRIDIAEDIRRARRRTGMTQENFCALCENVEPLNIQVTRRDLSKYENGINTPPADKYRKILDVADQYTAQINLRTLLS